MRASVMALALAVSASGTAKAANIAISCGAVGLELALCREGAEAWARQTGHSVAIISTPNQTDQRLALYQQLLAAGSDDVDVLQIDVVWPGILGRHFVDLSVVVPEAVRGGHFDALMENNRVDGRLVAMPWFADVGLLYYRRDLLEKHGESVPETWTDLTSTAERIQEAERRAGNGNLWGFVFQARAYEGLTCNALEWVYSHGGGSLVDADGGITIDNPNAARALDRAAAWVGRIAPKGVLNYAEEDARGVFQLGNAVFMRNWPYAWALINAAGSSVNGKVGIAPLPAAPEGETTGVLGGWQLAVSKYSRHPAIAGDLVRFLTSAREQRRRALEASFNPTIRSLYEDRDLLAANPYFRTLAEILERALPRPSRVTGNAYNRVSSSFWNAVHAILSGKTAAEERLARLDDRLKRIRGDGW